MTTKPIYELEVGEKWVNTELFGRINVGLLNPPLWMGGSFLINAPIVGSPTTGAKAGASTPSKTKKRKKTSISSSKQPTTVSNSRNGAKKQSKVKNGSR